MKKDGFKEFGKEIENMGMEHQIEGLHDMFLRKQEADA